MDFGLGLVLSFTDNATAGINNAVNTLNQLTQTAERASTSLDQMASLSALSVVSGQIGNSFTSMGHNIISTLGQVIGKVNETGQTLMYAEKQLDALYANSGKTGQDVVNQIQKYAKESMFDFENLIPAVTSLKSVGIEAFDAITSSTGNAQHSLLDYASALASFAPQMRNAYGTGVNAAIGAMREYIAEGNAMSLKRGAGLDITGILGEDKGATIEERTRQVADLVEQLGMLGMVDSMKSSAQVKLSNMGDVLFQLKGMISDSDIGGVSSAMVELIDVFYNFVDGIEQSRLESIARNIGGALSSLLKPVIALSKKLVGLAEGFVSLVENNPALVKFITVGTAIAGVLLVLAGVALKFTSAFSGVSLMILASGTSFKQIGGLFKTGALKMLSVLLPLTATLGLLYLAWKNDFAGIKTNVTSFVSNLGISFKTARDTVNGSVADLTTTLTELRNKGDFFSNLTIGIMQVMMLGKALADAWGDYELSEENYLKAKELGILPLIEAILDLKYRFGFFKEGFIKGWNDIAENVKQAISGFTESVQGTFLGDMLNNLTEFFQKLSSGDTQAWYDFGESFADITANALVFWSVLKLVGGVAKILTPLVTIFHAISKLQIGGVIGQVIGVLKGGQGIGVLSKLVEVFKAVASGGISLHNALSIVFGTATTVIAGVSSFIGGALIAFTNFFSMLKNGFSWVKEILMVVGVALATVGAIILGAPALIAGVIGAIVAGIATAVVVIKEHWNSIKTAFLTAWNWIGTSFNNIMTGAVNLFLRWAFGKVNGFINAINFAIGIINAIPGVNISKLTPLAVPQLAQGGIVDKPTLSVVGEAGREAVMPLENNTGWLSNIATMIASELRDFRPTNSRVVSASNNQGGHSYLTNNNNTTHTIQGSTDNSIVIQKGAIQVNVQNATDEEAMRLAKKILEYIKRQQELDKMVNYA